MATKTQLPEYVLDTDICSYIIKNKPAIVGTKLQQLPIGSVAISAITQAELLYGLKKLPYNHPLHNHVEQFLLRMPVLAWCVTATQFYADIRYQLVSSGQPIGEMDMMIAAHALALKATLVTNNLRHYQRIKLTEQPLLLQNWLQE